MNVGPSEMFVCIDRRVSREQSVKLFKGRAGLVENVLIKMIAV